jgi:uncharacterized membrane protein
VLSIVFVGIVLAAFKKKYGREYTFGKVIEVKDDLVKVKVNYDICSSVKPGLHYFRYKNVKEGDVVKLRTQRGFFTITGSKVVEIIEVQ